MMESPRIEDEKIIKYVKNLIRLEKLKKETADTSIKDIRNLVKLEKENKAIKDRIIRDTGKVFRLQKENKGIKDRIVRDNRNVFEHKEDNYNKLVRVGKFRSNNYIEYNNKGDRKALSAEEYLNKIKPYLKNVIDDLKISDK